MTAIQYWAICGGTFVVPITELNETDYDALLNNFEFKSRSQGITCIPVYFCRGRGVWPTPASEIQIVQNVDVSEI